MSKNIMVVGPDQMPDWLEKRRSIMDEIDSQLIRGLLEPGKGLTLEQLQMVVEHRNPFEVAMAADDLSGYNLTHFILGRDFIPPEEVAKAMGLEYTSDQLQMFWDTLPSEDVLNYCRNHGFMLVAGPPRPMNLLEIRDLQPEYFYSKTGGWFADEKEQFSRDDKMGTTWLALRKEPLPNSTSRNWDEQIALLPTGERVPNTAETTWGLTAYKVVRGIYLMPNVYVRTYSLASDGLRVLVGCFGEAGLLVSFHWGNGRLVSLGLAASLKFQTEN